jgi:alpha-tubulin suppressor-like RCC1 family protein/plastocyanin
MALSFPGSPSVNQIHVDASTGNVYQWNGTVWINFNTQNPKNIKELDNIAGSFNGSDTTFALTSGSYPITPVSATQVIISIGGVVQSAGTDYTVSGSNITFTTPPDGGLTFYGLSFGGKVLLSSVDAGSINYYNLSTGAPVWDSAGNITISGIATIGTSSIVVNGVTNRVTIGTASTIASDSIVTTGIITAGSFTGDGSGLTNLPPIGIGTEGSVNTTGIITAVSFSGDGSGLTNIGGLLEPLIYSPGIGATGIAATTNIVLTYQKPIEANVGIVTIQTAALTYNQAITSPGSGLYGIVGNGRDGNISGNNQAIKINIGDTIIFNNSVSGSHPLYIRVSDGGASVSTPAASGEGTATVTWTPNTAGTYYYQCSIHSAMIGTLTVQDNVSERFDIATAGIGTTVSISNATLTLNPATDLGIGGTSYYVLFPANAIQDSFGTSDSVGISSYYFETVAAPAGAFAAGYYFITGQDRGGNLGLNDIIDRSSPTQVPGLWTHTNNGSTAEHTLSLKSDNTLWAWGANSYGRLGVNDLINRSSPVQIPGTQWKGSGRDLARPSSVGYSHNTNMVLKTDGTMWVWGRSTYGQMGLNNNVDRSSPTQVPGTWNQAIMDRHNVYATKTDGTLWAWGQNSWGANSTNDTADRSSPIQIPGTQWDRIACSNYSPFITKTDGTLWTWGYNGSGQLCTNDTKNRSSPIQIPGTQWIVNTHGYYGFAATKTDGTLWMAGNGGYGMSGQNDGMPRSSPIQIPGTQWKMTNGGYGVQGGIKTDGTIWVWGYNNKGQLGLNSLVHRSSPTQIPGTDWIDFGGTEYVSVFLKST